MAHKAQSTAVIFGGSGFIGRHVTEYLLSTSSIDRVVLADIAPPRWAIPREASFVRSDVREPISIDSESAELIVNLAAVHRTPGHPDHEYHETNESGAENVCSFADEVDCRRVWFSSSIAVYGPDEDAKTEASEPRPVSAYGKSKLAAEGIHRAWVERKPGRKLVISRPATVFGQGEGGNFTRLAAAMKRRAFLYPGRRDTLKACGYVKDLPRAFESMEQLADPAALFNFAYPTPPTIEEVCSAFSEVGALPKPAFTLPAGALLRVGATLNAVGVTAVNPERVKKLTRSTNVRGTALQESGFKFQFDLEEGLADWFAQAPASRFD